MINFSYEFFPPKGDAQENFVEVIAQYCKDSVKPSFLSVTCGAGGGAENAHQKTIRAIKIALQHNNNATPHFTASGLKKAEALEILTKYSAMGVTNLLVLRGDANKGNGDFNYATDLLQFINEQGFSFDLKVACYPEIHPDSNGDFEKDYRVLLHKQELGASQAISQFFLDPEYFLRFRDQVVSRGVDKMKVIPGVLPITSFQQLNRFTQLSGNKVPKKIYNIWEKYQESELLTQYLLSEQISMLIREGVRDLHFYTLNKYKYFPIIQDYLSA
jgi:methylenetetrahydrofolate reductase (NADPH)